jgi:hypothetical protein
VGVADVSETPAPEVVRWYTRARKFPQLIGRTPDGRRIPGGPYTFTQAVGAGVVLLAGVNTMGWWARYGLIGNGLLLLGVAYGVVLGLGRIPVGSRSPLAVASGGVRALAAPRVGRLAGRSVRLRRPHRVRCRLVTLSSPRILPSQPAQPVILPTTAPGAAAMDTARYTTPDVVGRSPARVGKVSVATPAVPAGEAGTTPPSRWRTRAGRPRAVGRAGSMLMRRCRIRGPVATHPAAAVDVPAQLRAMPGKGPAAAARAGQGARRVPAVLSAERGGRGSASAAGPAEASRGSAAPPALSGVQLLLARAGGPEGGS